MVVLFKHYGAPSSGPDAMRKGRIELDHGASIAANAVAEATFTFPGAKVGDVVWASPLSTLSPGTAYAGARPVAAGIVAIALANITSATINPAAISWDVACLVS